MSGKSRYFSFRVTSTFLRIDRPKKQIFRLLRIATVMACWMRETLDDWVVKINLPFVFLISFSRVSSITCSERVTPGDSIRTQSESTHVIPSRATRAIFPTYVRFPYMGVQSNL